MLRIDLRVKTEDIQRFLNSVRYDLRFEYWESKTFFSYRHNFKVICDNQNTFWIGLERNSNTSEKYQKDVTLEFNPSKVGDDLTFLSVYKRFFDMKVSLTVKRFDLALDVPIARDRCYLVKDYRTYQEYRNSSSDLTQYLGQRNSGGFCKLYNKAKELKIDNYDLTRFEITIDWKDSEYGKTLCMIPKIYILDDFQVGFNLNGTDKVLLISCLQDMSLVDELPRRKKEKIRELLENNSLILQLDELKYNTILSQVNEYAKGILEFSPLNNSSRLSPLWGENVFDVD